MCESFLLLSRSHAHRKGLRGAASFLENVLVYELLRFTSGELIADDPEYSRELFEGFCGHGFALLDMQGCAEARHC